MRIFLTGATGLVCRSLAARLAAEGHARTPVNRRMIDMKKANVPEAWLPHLAGIDTVVFFLAPSAPSKLALDLAGPMALRNLTSAALAQGEAAFRTGALSRLALLLHRIQQGRAEAAAGGCA